MRVPTKLLGILAIIIILAAATGCDSGNGSNNQALTEIDFANNPSLQADPDKQVIVDFLESPSSKKPANDTGTVGIDEIPLTYTKTETHTFCWEDENSEAMDYMVLLDSQGEEVIRVDVNGDCVTATIEPGDYVMQLHHDESMGDPLPIFIIPNPDQNQQAREIEGFIDRFKMVASNILKRIERTVTKDAKAQTVIEDIDILLSTKNCDFCSLLNVDLIDALLIDIQLEGADLRGADFTGAVLNEVNFSYSGLGPSRNVYVQIVDNNTGLVIGDIVTPVPELYTQFSGSIVLESDFIGANLTGADFSGADVLLSDFSGANLLNVNLSGADLSGTDFSLATWCNGCICAEGSIGVCNGCAPVDICTGL